MQSSPTLIHLPTDYIKACVDYVRHHGLDIDHASVVIGFKKQQQDEVLVFSDAVGAFRWMPPDSKTLPRDLRVFASKEGAQYYLDESQEVYKKIDKMKSTHIVSVLELHKTQKTGLTINE